MAPPQEQRTYTFRVTYYSGAAEVLHVKAAPYRVGQALGRLLRLLRGRLRAARLLGLRSIERLDG